LEVGAAIAGIEGESALQQRDCAVRFGGLEIGASEDGEQVRRIGVAGGALFEEDDGGGDVSAIEADFRKFFIRPNVIGRGNDFLLPLRDGLVEVAFLLIKHGEVVVGERERSGFGSAAKFGFCGAELAEGQIGFAEEEMEMRSVSTGSDESLEDATRVVSPFHHAVAGAQHEEEFEIVLLAVLDGLEGSDGGGEVVHHKVTNAFEVESLKVGRIGGENLAEVRGGGFEFALAEVGEAEIEANAGNGGGKSLRFKKRMDGVIQPAGTKVNDTQIGVDRGGAHTEFEELVEIVLCDGVLAIGKGLLAVFGDGFGIGVSGLLGECGMTEK